MDEVEIRHLMDHERPIGKATDENMRGFVEGTGRQLRRHCVVCTLRTSEHMPVMETN
jgi:hypothetical protein